jgi:cysteine desulfurase
MRIYFDHNATTPVAPAVADAIARTLRDDFGNPSSVHAFGQRTKASLDEARAGVAGLVRAEPSEIVFTSSGTEADNLAIRGGAEAMEPAGRRHLIAAAIEHEAVLNTVKALARRGWQTTLLSVDPSNIVSPDRLAEAMTDHTALVSVMHANNEIGTIQRQREVRFGSCCTRAAPLRERFPGSTEALGRAHEDDPQRAPPDAVAERGAGTASGCSRLWGATAEWAESSASG